jgi:ankyrin repeat protein
MLIDANANVNHACGPILNAAQENHLAVVKALIEAKANVNHFDKEYQETALFCACKYVDNHEIVSTLLQAGADTDPVGVLTSPLCLTAHIGAAKSMKHLLAAGALLENSGNARDEETPLIMACLQNRIEIVQILIDAKAPLNSVPGAFDSVSALIGAATMGHADIARLLLKAKADPNLKCRRGNTAMLTAVQENHHETVKRICNRDDVSAHSVVSLNKDGGPKKLHLHRDLIAAKADVNLPGAMGTTPLLHAIAFNNVEAAKDLLAAGAKTNVVNIFGEPPLSTALHAGNAAIVSALVEAKADLNHCNKSGATLLDMARSSGRSDIAAILQRAGAPSAIDRLANASPLMRAVSQGDAAATEAAFGTPRFPKEHELAFIFAARLGKVACLELLMDKGLSASCQINGESALMLACQHGMTESVKVLLARGADVSAKRKDGLTAVQIASKGKFREIVDALMTKVNELKKNKA